MAAIIPNTSLNSYFLKYKYILALFVSSSNLTELALKIIINPNIINIIKSVINIG